MPICQGWYAKNGLIEAILQDLQRSSKDTSMSICLQISRLSAAIRRHVGHLPWGFPADIWPIGVMVSWVEHIIVGYMQVKILTGVLWYRPSNFWKEKNLFDPIDRVNGQYIPPLALAQYIGYYGHPSTEYYSEELPFLNPEVRATSNGIIPDEWFMRPVEEML